MKLITELILRVILVVAIIDTIAFYIISIQAEPMTFAFAVGVIVITIVVLLINILFCLHKKGVQ